MTREPVPRIRDYRASDFETLFEIDRECFPPGVAYSRDELAGFLSRSRGCEAIHENAGEIKGFAIGMMKGRSAGHLVTIDVLTDSRHGGVGQALLARIEEILVARGARRVYLEVAVNNEAARRFYGRAGYESVSDLPGFYGPGKDGIRMKKDFAL